MKLKFEQGHPAEEIKEGGIETTTKKEGDVDLINLEFGGGIDPLTDEGQYELSKMSEESTLAPDDVPEGAKEITLIPGGGIENLDVSQDDDFRTTSGEAYDGFNIQKNVDLNLIDSGIKNETLSTTAENAKDTDTKMGKYEPINRKRIKKNEPTTADFWGAYSASYGGPVPNAKIKTPNVPFKKIPEQEDNNLSTIESLKRDRGDRPKYYDETPDDVKPRQQPPALPKTNPETQPPPLPKKSRGELLDSIDKENELTRMINSEEFGPAKGFISTHFSKLKSKFGWVKDGLISLFVLKPRETKLDIVLGWNELLLNKKQKDLDKAIGKAEKAKKSSEQDKLDRENKLEQINESLERARRDGNIDMVNLLTRAKEGLEKQNSRELAGEAAENMKEQMLFYRKRKERILDDFIGDIDSRTEKIREDTEYYKNLERRSLIDDGIGRLQGVITKGETEMLNLKTAMSAPGLSRADRKIIKTKINEISNAIGESRGRLGYYNRVRDRLEDLVEATDNRTNRFDEYKKPYVEAVNRLKPNKTSRKTATPSVGKKITPPPLPGSSERADWENERKDKEEKGGAKENGAKKFTADSTADSTPKDTEVGGMAGGVVDGLEESVILSFVDSARKGLEIIDSFTENDIGNQQNTNSLFNNIKTMRDKIRGFLDRAKLANEETEGHPLVKLEDDLLKIIKGFGGGKGRNSNKTIDKTLLDKIRVFCREMNDVLNS